MDTTFKVKRSKVNLHRTGHIVAAFCKACLFINLFIEKIVYHMYLVIILYRIEMYIDTQHVATTTYMLLSLITIMAKKSNIKQPFVGMDYLLY